MTLTSLSSSSQQKTSLSWTQKTSNLLTFIQFNHTLFALPFALIAMLVAARGVPSLTLFLLILLSMVSARTAAMAFNRYIDWNFDQQNPRTAHRSQLASRSTALTLLLSSLFIFITAAAWINPLCFLLSPLAILLILGYSLTKRFTAWTHAFLGLALAASPMGAWAAVTGRLDTLAPWALAAAVASWVFGFDLIYATMDRHFDRKIGLYSFPACYGFRPTLLLSRSLHAFTFLSLLAFGLIAELGVAYWIGLIAVLPALIVEHRLSQSDHGKQIHVAFFQINAWVSLLLLTSVTIDQLWT